MFNTAMWYLNVLHLSFIAQFIRWSIVKLTPGRFQRLASYQGTVAGYKGWLSVPVFGVLAFVREDDDTLQYRW